MKRDGIRLSDFVAGVRDELEVAAQRQKIRAESGPVDEIGPMKVTRLVLEAEVVTMRDDITGAKIGYWIAEVNGEKKVGASTTQKVIIELEVEGVFLGGKK